MGDTHEAPPPFSSLTFKTIGSNSLLRRISDKAPGTLLVTAADEDEDDLYVGMEIDPTAPEPHGAQPSLLERISDQHSEANYPGVVFFHPNGTYSPLPLPLTPTFDTALRMDSNPVRSVPDQPGFPKQDTIPIPKKGNLGQTQDARPSFLYREPDCPAASFVPPVQTDIDLPTPPPSASFPTSRFPMTPPHLAVSPPQNIGPPVPLYPFTPLTKLLQEERDAWSEVLETKQAHVDRASSCAQSLSNDAERHERDPQAKSSHLLSPLELIPNASPQTLTPCILRQHHDHLLPAEVTPSAETSNGSPTPIETITSTHAQNNDSAEEVMMASSNLVDRTTSRPFLNASQLKQDGACDDDVFQQDSQNQVPSTQLPAQPRGTSKLASPREEELKSLLRARGICRGSRSIKATDDDTSCMLPRSSPSAPNREGGAIQNSSENPEGVNEKETPQSKIAPASLSADNTLPTLRGSTPVNSRYIEDDHPKRKPFSPSRQRSATVHHSFPLSLSNHAMRAPMTGEGVHSESRGVPSHTPSSSSELSSSADICPPPAVASASPPGRLVPSTSSTRRNGIGNGTPIVKTEETDNGILCPSIGVSANVKKEEQEDIKIPLKLEEDIKPLGKDNSGSRNPARGCPKKEEDSSDIPVMQALDSTGIREPPGHKSDPQAEYTGRGTSTSGPVQDDGRRDNDGDPTGSNSDTDEPTGIKESQPSRTQNTLSDQQTAAVDSLVEPQQGNQPTFSGLSSCNAVDAGRTHDDSPKKVLPPSSSQDIATPGMLQPAPPGTFKNSYCDPGLRRVADSWVPQTYDGRDMRQRSRSRERPPHLLDHWSPSRNTVSRPNTSLRSRPVADTYRPPMIVPRRFRDDLGDEDHEDRLLQRRVRESRSRFSPPFRGRSPSPRRTNNDRLQDSPPYRFPRPFGDNSVSPRHYTQAAPPRSPHGRIYAPRRDFEGTQHYDDRHVRRDATGIVGNAPFPERRFVPNATYRAMQDRRDTSTRDTDVGRSSVNGYHERVTSPGNAERVADRIRPGTGPRPCEKDSTNHVQESRTGTTGQVNLSISHTRSCAIQPLLSPGPRDDARSPSSIQLAIEPVIDRNSFVEVAKQNDPRGDLEPEDVSTRHDSGRGEDDQLLVEPNLDSARVEKDDLVAHDLTESPPDIPSSRMRSPIERGFLPSVHSTPERQGTGERSRAARPILPASSEKTEETSVTDRRNVNSPSLAQRIGDDLRPPMQHAENLRTTSAAISPRLPIPSLSSRLGDILIEDRRGPYEDPPSDLPLSSRITAVKPDVRPPRNPPPSKPVPYRKPDNGKGSTSPSIRSEDFRSSVNPPTLLKRMRSMESDHYDPGRPAKQTRGGRGAVPSTPGRGRGRGHNGSQHSPRGSFHAPSSSKRSLEDRLS